MFAVLFGRGKLIFFVAVLFLTAGCVFQRAPAQETAGQNEPPAVGRIGDLRARSGEGKEKEGGQELSFPQGSGAGEVSPERAAIEQTYLARLRSVAGAYEEKINALYARARQELSSLPPADTQKRAAVAAQYYAAGRALESECDSIIYRELAAFEEALRARGYPVDRVREARDVYESTKKKRAAQLLPGDTR